MERNEEEEEEKEKWVYDSSVDYKGRVPLRASTGVWKTSLFIIAIEFSERLSYFGIATNLITYLTSVIHQDLKTAVKNVNCWSGVTTLMPLLGAFLADAYAGRFSMVLFSSLIYLVGLCLLTMSQVIPSLKPCTKVEDFCEQNPKKVHEVVFFLAIYFISLGTGGHKPCLESFGADQFDDDHSEERKQKMSYFNWWNFAVCCGLLLGVTVIVYVQDDVGWGVASLVLAVVMVATIFIFYAGRPFYRYRVATGSPLTPLLRVLYSAFSKRNLPYPSNPHEVLYEVPMSQKPSRRLLSHTNKFKFLDKAAIITEEKQDMSEENQNQIGSWKLATVTEVEEMKLILKMIPIWLTSLPFGICVSQASTFFIKQASTMNRTLITHNFKFPPASIYSLAAIGMIISVLFYEKILVPVLRKSTGNERGIDILHRIGIGMVFSSISMASAAIVERKRLDSLNPISAFWLAPQFLIIGIGDGFTLVGLQEYFYDQVPDSMRSLGIAFYLSVIGVGNFLSNLLIIVVDYWTNKIDRSSWIGKDLNKSSLDKFYWLLAAINGVNLCVYGVLARRYSYKNVANNYRRHDENDEVEIVAL